MSGDVTAFVPAHITGFFSVHRTAEPATTGSRGAGLTLSDGIQTTVSSSDHSSVSLDGEAVSIEAVERVLKAVGVSATVSCRTGVPVGAGFGVSGGAALGTALAANELFQAGYTERELVSIAHVAEVQAGSGLGDVVAQARGGLPLRLEPGAQPHCRLDGVVGGGPIEYLTFGERSTADVIGGETAALSRAGEDALEAVRQTPSKATLVERARQFGEEAGLLSAKVETVLADVSASGGSAAMAMLGDTVFALDSGLSDAGYDPERTQISASRATVVPAPPRM